MVTRQRIAWMLMFFLAAGVALNGEAPTGAATQQFNSYVAAIEQRLAHQHRAHETFLANADWARLQRGEPVIERLTPTGIDAPGAMMHDWRGTAFVPGAKAADFERLMQDFAAYPRVFAPQVIRARVLTHADADHLQAEMRLKQKHVITVVMDTTYDIGYGRLDAQHGYSVSRSTKITEVADAGTANEHALSEAEAHGFLWRLNSYWSYEERDGGLYVQIESVSLTRSIPTGLGWMIGPFVESVPRESLEFTLGAVCRALRR